MYGEAVASGWRSPPGWRAAGRVPLGAVAGAAGGGVRAGGAAVAGERGRWAVLLALAAGFAQVWSRRRRAAG